MPLTVIVLPSSAIILSPITDPPVVHLVIVPVVPVPVTALGSDPSTHCEPETVEERTWPAVPVLLLVSYIDWETCSEPVIKILSLNDETPVLSNVCLIFPSPSEKIIWLLNAAIVLPLFEPMMTQSVAVVVETPANFPIKVLPLPLKALVEFNPDPALVPTKVLLY